MTDGRGGELQTWVAFDGACAAPGTVRYDVYVVRPAAPDVRLAAATTLVRVTSP